MLGHIFQRDMSWYYAQAEIFKKFPSLFRRQIETNKIGGSQTKTLINYAAPHWQQVSSFPDFVHFYTNTSTYTETNTNTNAYLKTNTRRKPEQNCYQLRRGKFHIKFSRLCALFRQEITQSLVLTDWAGRSSQKPDPLVFLFEYEFVFVLVYVFVFLQLCVFVFVYV